jgi:general L-amino acid transport system permease protein
MTGKDRSLTSLLNDSYIRGIFFQILLALGLVFLGSWLVDNTLTNLSNQGKTLGFDFLTRTAGFQITNTWHLDA